MNRYKALEVTLWKVPSYWLALLKNKASRSYPSALASGYHKEEGELCWVVKFSYLGDERNLRVTQTVLFYEGCENTLCPVVTESKSPFEATGSNYRGLQCFFQWIVLYLVTVLSEQRQLCECKPSISNRFKAQISSHWVLLSKQVSPMFHLYVSKDNQIYCLT